ncbi:MAG TPA: hypothetical protein VHZ55_04050 [Bryobacteraceae bacterium]|nr:hypothetical protein [Bryobacteraceae bacterium]
MSTRYKELFSIRCRHAYFSDGRCPVLELTPTSDCGRLIARYRCLFRAGTVYYGDEGGENLLQSFDETVPFKFSLTSTWPDLDRCTDSPLDPVVRPDKSVYYFSNAREERATPGAEELLLHPPGLASANGPLPVETAQFVHVFEQAVSASDLRLFDGLGCPVAWKGADLLGEPVKSVSLDLQGVRPGRYSIAAKGSERYEFYLSFPAAPKVWGLVDIFLGGRASAKNVPEACRLIDEDGKIRGPLSFVILLNARRSFWRYLVVNQPGSNRSYDNFRIVTGSPIGSKESAPVIEFRDPVRTKINGTDCWMFESRTEMDLCEKPSEHYELCLRSTGRVADGVASFALPYASPQNTLLEQTDAGAHRVCSDIYVNL